MGLKLTLALVFLLLAVFLVSGQQGCPAKEPAEVTEAQPGLTQQVPVEEGVEEMIVAEPGTGEDDGTTETTRNIVEYTSQGFSPSSITIKKGDTIKWINKADSQVWPASAIHPTHTVYPGSGIKKCGSSEEGNIFDACKRLDSDQEYSFTFDNVGKWFYHNHLRPGHTGKIFVLQ